MRRGDYAEIAKLAIAYHIGGCERDSRLQNTNPPHWFQRLFTRLIEGIETPEQFAAKNKVAVITFNYDRSFERSLWLGLQSIFPLHKYSAFEVARAHQAIKVTHVHGHLGDLPEIAQFSNGVFVRPRQYHGPTDVNDFAMAAGGIKVVSEINDNPAEFTEAQRMLSDANVVVFLGYGFDPTNNAHLSFKKMQRDANIHACTRGMHRGTWKGLRTTFQRITGHEPITEIQHPAAGFMAHILPILK